MLLPVLLATDPAPADDPPSEEIELADEADRILSQDGGSRSFSDASSPMIIPST